MTKSKANKIARLLLLALKESIMLGFLLVNYSLRSLMVSQWPEKVKKAFKIQSFQTEEVNKISF